MPTNHLLFSLFSVIVVFLVAQTIGTSSYEGTTPCGFENNTLLHWNITDSYGSRYPLYLYDTKTSLTDIDGAGQPIANNIESTTFTLLTYDSAINVINSKTRQVKNLLTCQDIICDSVKMLPTIANNNKKLYSLIVSRDVKTGLGSINYFDVTDLENITEMKSMQVVVPNAESNNIYDKDGKVIGSEKEDIASLLSMDPSLSKSLQLQVIYNKVDGSNQLVILQQSNSTSVHLLVAKMNEQNELSIQSSKLIIPTVSEFNYLLKNGLLMTYQREKQQLDIVVKLYRTQQLAFESFYSLEHDAVIKFGKKTPKNLENDYVPVLIQLDLSNLGNIGVLSIKQLMTSESAPIITQLSNNDLLSIELNDITISSTSTIVIVGSVKSVDEDIESTSGFIYTMNLETYIPFKNVENTEFYTTVDLGVETDNSRSLKVTANFYGFNDTIAVGTLQKLNDAMEGYVHLYSNDLSKLFGYKQMRENQGIQSVFQVELYPDEIESLHLFMAWNRKGDSSVISTITFTCELPIIREGWQIMLVAVFGGEFATCALIAIVFVAYKKIKERMNAPKSYEQV
ncbi:hypothetical protein ABK040_005838 [Willaertia magna]